VVSEEETKAMSEFKAQHAGFVDSKGRLLEIHSKQMKDGSFQVVAYHQPKNGKRQRGCVGSFTDADLRDEPLCSALYGSGTCKVDEEAASAERRKHVREHSKAAA
jgi:hypothetical protein